MSACLPVCSAQTQRMRIFSHLWFAFFFFFLKVENSECPSFQGLLELLLPFSPCVCQAGGYLAWQKIPIRCNRCFLPALYRIPSSCSGTQLFYRRREGDSTKVSHSPRNASSFPPPREKILNTAPVCPCILNSVAEACGVGQSRLPGSLRHLRGAGVLPARPC